jgi:hypothetical protein
MTGDNSYSSQPQLENGTEIVTNTSTADHKHGDRDRGETRTSTHTPQQQQQQHGGGGIERRTSKQTKSRRSSALTNELTVTATTAVHLLCWHTRLGSPPNPHPHEPRLSTAVHTNTTKQQSLLPTERDQVAPTPPTQTEVVNGPSGTPANSNRSTVSNTSQTSSPVSFNTVTYSAAC